LVFNAEGIQAAEYLNSIGVAAFVLKYRLGREEGSPYEIDVHAKQDGLRAMRLVRSRAKEWGLDPERIGIMGFSAGGEVVSMVAYASEEEAATSSDPLDAFSSQPNFQILIYPGPLGIPEQIPADAPPAFLLVANDDVGASRSVMQLIPKLRQAKVPVEAHIFARGGHAFNMGNRSQLATIKDWPRRLSDWLQDNEFLRVPARETEPSE
jgi:acetyl esterase/lipase